MTKKVVIFDFDGTIIDSMNAFADIASGVLNQFFDTPPDVARKQYIETSGLPFFEQVELLHPKDPKNKSASDAYETIKKQGYLSHKAFDDVPDIMRILNAKHAKTVVSSNNFQELVDALVGKLGLEFDLVLGWQNKHFAKGHAHFEHTQKKLNCKHAEMLFVGDSLKDADRAREYGINFVAKAGTFSRNDFEKYDKNIVVIDSLRDLVGILT